MDSKVCSKCGCSKLLSDYSPRKEGKNLMSQCKQCRAEKRKLERAANPEKFRDIQRRSRAKKPKEFHYERARKQHLLTKYGVTPEQYQAMWDEQGGLCYICEQPETRVDSRHGLTKLAVDHSHTRGGIRRLLCVACNTGLGQFKDSPLLLTKAADYLEAYS